MEKIEAVISARERDLGGFNVRRILPYASHKMVGPFIFFDHMGPATFTVNQGINVRPHPHIHLATVTYLFEGKICHRDSLGSIQLIEPGAINWMIAGHGIVHSERTPPELLISGSRLNGIQCWVALPSECENMPPSFMHYPSSSLPQFKINDVELTLLLGRAFNHTSPVVVQSDLFYLKAQFLKGNHLTLASEGRESAVYVVKGNIRLHGQDIQAHSMAVVKVGEDLSIEALSDAQVMLLGGQPVGKRYIYWNFVSSKQKEIESAKLEWANGPGESGSRFPRINGDENEYIPLPVEEKEANPKGNIM